MKLKLSFFIFLTLAAATITAQDQDSLRQIIKAMKFGIPALSPIPSSVQNVKVATISLNGTWKFNPDGKDFSKSSNIEVPGEWEMQGFKVKKGSSATYWKSFSIPGDWEGNQVKIRFDGISSRAIIRVNGKTAGSHEGSFVAFELDISGAVKPGDNILEVEVQCETISDILACTSQYAAHPVGGILRKVTLMVLPPTHISDFAWSVKFDREYRDASLTVNSSLAVNGKTGNHAQLKFSVQDTDGKYAVLSKNIVDVPVHNAVSNAINTILVKSPKKWDPEHPNLYILTTSLVVDGKVLQTNIQRIGFRQIELRGNRFFVNNFPIKLKGVNHHEVHPLRGRSLTPELCRKDVELFRAGNCNYLRTSHYPPSEEFLQACDEMGMFVESESSLCWIEHGASPVWKTWNYLDTQYLPYMVRANFDNILSGRQHPCIIIWSLGNESRWSPLWERVLSEVKKLDPTRPASFHDQCWGNFNNAGSTADIANYHYPGFNGPVECEKNKTRPTLFGEYMHVQCYARREVVTDPSVRSDAYATTLKQMVDSVYKYPACLGGAIWSGIDDIFHLSGDKICGYGPWGIIDGWRRKKPEFTGMRKSYSPVIITNLKSAKAVKGKIRLELENRYNFLNLNELKIIAKIGNRVIPVRADIAPMTRGQVIIDLSGSRQTDDLLLTFTDPRGFVCQEEVIAAEKPVQKIALKENVNVSLAEENNSFIIRSGEATFTIDKIKGTLEYLAPGGEKIITGGGLMMLVPFNDDDGGAPDIAGNNYTQDIKTLEYNPVGNSKVEAISYRKLPDGSVQVDLSEVMGEKLTGTKVFVFNTDGKVVVSYDYETLADYTRDKLLRQFGLLFTLPVSFSQLSWERTGLWTIYPEYDINRLTGSAKALPRDLTFVESPHVIPSGEWKDDANKLGTNDFRSTKDHILKASLKNDNAAELMVQSDGSQSVRAWIDGDKTRLFVAGLNGPGSCGFFTGSRPKFKKGDHLTGKFTVSVQ